MPIISKNQLDKIKSFFNILEDNNVRYIVLRGFKSLPERIRTDLDIACHPDDQYTFYELARKHLSCNAYPYIAQINGREIFYWDFFIDADKDEDNEYKSIRMDLYNGIFWFHGKQYYPDGKITQDYVFDNRIKNAWFYVPSPELDVIFNILRCVYDKKTTMEDKKVGKKYREIVEERYNECKDEKLIEVLKNTFPRLGTIAGHLMDETVKYIKNKDYPNLTKMILRLRTH